MANFTKKDLELVANNIRTLSMDGIQKANSGHPGMPMGTADYAAVLFLKFLKHNPKDPKWADRDRLILSGGHGSMLLYTMLHLSGYNLPMSELKSFRQWGSKTPGHPEYGHTIGVESTTGPLGQGCGNAVGMALAESMLSARFNKKGFPVVNHHTYVMLGDGDLMEGISHESFSLAGHLKLNKIIAFYDSNKITIEGATDLAFSEDVKKRFQGYKWNVIEIDGHDHSAIEKAIRAAQKVKDKPTIIIGKTIIGKGSPNKAGTASAHGEPLGADEIKLTKKNMGMPSGSFVVLSKVRACFQKRLNELKKENQKWAGLYKKYQKKYPALAKQWAAGQKGEVPADIDKCLPVFDPAKALATRAASGKVIQELAKAIPHFVGGSADLAPSNKTFINDGGSVKAGDFSGKNLHFGVREHGMGAVMNGMALHGGFIVFGGTFFVFSDYCRPSMRLAAMMNLPVVYVMTHDSFYVGEDGPTHEPVEHIASFRAMHNMTVMRPADPTETSAAWAAALKNKQGPTCMLLTRQGLPVLDRKVFPPAKNVEKGAYTLWQNKKGSPKLILMATGSEVSLALDAAKELAKQKKIIIRVVSMPALELFEKQSEKYKESVLPASCTARVSVEAASTFGWQKYVGDKGRCIGLDRFGASAPYKVLADKFGFTVKNVVKVAKEVI